jgi:hypothetical protein
MVKVGDMEWVQVAGTWNRCGWQAHGMGVGGRHVEWVQVGGWQACRAGISVQNKRGSEGVVWKGNRPGVRFGVGIKSGNENVGL